MIATSNEIRFTGPRVQVSEGPPGLQGCPGRNDPRYGAWLIETLCADVLGAGRLPVVVDPMCGGGQLWMQRPAGTIVYGCELKPARVEIARQNGIIAQQGEAETYRPPVADIDLVATSFPYRNCDHVSGKGAKQQELIRSKGLQSMQAIEPVPCFWRVLAQIATWCGGAPVALIHKNYIDGQAVVDEIEELSGALVMAGFEPPARWWRRVRPGFTEQGKLARGEYQARTGAKYRVIEMEYVLVTRRS